MKHWQLIENQPLLRQIYKEPPILSRDKEVSPWFWSKIGYFSIFSHRELGEEYVLYYILEQQKNAFLGYKNKKFKKGLLQGYSKVVSKNWLFFHLFFFRQYRPGKCSLLYSRAKNAFLGYKNKRFKKSKY